MKKTLKKRRKERKKRKTNSHIACVASVSVGVRRECWDEIKKDVRNKTGGNGEKRKPLISCRSNFHAINRLEMLATPANEAQNLTTSNKNSLMIHQEPLS